MKVIESYGLIDCLIDLIEISSDNNKVHFTVVALKLTSLWVFNIYHICIHNAKKPRFQTF